MTGAPEPPGPPHHPALDEALRLFERDGRGGRDPRLGITGPPGSGKSQLLQELLKKLSGPAEDRPARIPLLLDFSHAFSGSDEEIYSSAVDQLMAAAEHHGAKIAVESLPGDAGRRFEAVLRQMARSTRGDLIFAVDRLENVPLQFADNLAQRIRGLKESADAVPALGRMALIVSGALSLFELSRNGKSALFQMPFLRLPHIERESGRRFLRETLARHGVNEVADATVDKLWELTGAESCFLQPLIDVCRPALKRISADSVAAAAERLPASDHVRQIALHLEDASLREVVKNLAMGEEVLRQNAAPDIDPYQLAGALVVEGRNGAQLYRFRNGIVARLLTLALKRPRFGENRKRLGTGQKAILSELIQLDTFNRELASASDIFACNGPLQGAWTLLTRYHNPALDLYFAAAKHAPERLPLVPAEEEAPEATREAAANCCATRKPAFGWQREFAAFAVPIMAGQQSPICLVTTVPRPPVFTDFVLTHWQRFLTAGGATMTRLGLAEVGRRYLAEPPVPEQPDPNLTTEQADGSVPHGNSAASVRAEWAGGRGRLTLTPDRVSASDGGPWRQFEGRIDAGNLNLLNKNMLKFVQEGMSQEDFQQSANGFSSRFVLLLKDIRDLTRTLSEDARHWIVSSDIEGLKWPLEILRPDAGGALATRGALTRQISDYKPPKELRASFRDLLADVRERKKTLRALLVSSDTGGLPNARGEVNDIAKKLREACAALKLDVDCQVMTNPVDRELSSALVNPREHWHLFHFCGHGKHGRNASALQMHDSAGEIIDIRGETLEHWLRGAGLWLCFLNTCYAGAISGSPIDDEILSGGLVQNVLAAGVPTFAGFRCAVTSGSSRALALEFYARLLEVPEGSDPSLAMYRARKAVASSQEHPVDAATSSILVSQYVE